MPITSIVHCYGCCSEGCWLAFGDLLCGYPYAQAACASPNPEGIESRNPAAFGLEIHCPDPQHVEQIRVILDLIKGLILQDDVDPSKKMKRYHAWKRLSEFLVGPLDSDMIGHYCPFGCHSSRQEAVDEAVGLFEEVFLNHPPLVPAYNKFTKISPPVIWFMLFCSLFS